jgi:hypothetical protein
VFQAGRPGQHRFDVHPRQGTLKFMCSVLISSLIVVSYLNLTFR